MKNINIKLICTSTVITCIVVGYKYYSIHFANTFVLGGAVPTWFVLLILLVPVSPLLGRALKYVTNNNYDLNSDLAELINSLKGDE